MKTYVITLSKRFLKTHPRAGEPTNFREKFESGEKLHTMRSNYPYWNNIVNQVNSGKAVLSIREWSEEPYKSPQVEIAKLTELGSQRFKIDYKGDVKIDDRWMNNPKIDISESSLIELANNDGLGLKDFFDWFDVDKLIRSKKIFNGIVIHFTKFKY